MELILGIYGFWPNNSLVILGHFGLAVPLQNHLKLANKNVDNSEPATPVNGHRRNCIEGRMRGAPDENSCYFDGTDVLQRLRCRAFLFKINPFYAFILGVYIGVSHTHYTNFKPNNNFRPNPNWKPNPTPNLQKNQTNQFSRQPQNQGPSSFQNHPKPSFSVQKPIQPPRPASTQAVPMSWRTSNPNFHNMETGQETGNELENPGDNETENQIEYDQNYIRSGAFF
ncbi:unnamed protein product [Nesidiocoris tenuis]|uniref:Uncharacterized protein n=1 Tax=Nesidiocoris tenuis TaxID=355587 RepID=A0A6H5FX05_9HEMI|nr:unnamed protein product [Nesidiocoris tenuis]